MDGLIADFFYGDDSAPINADERLPHGVLALARLSPHVSPATVTAMDAKLDGTGNGAGAGPGAVSNAAGSADLDALDRPPKDAADSADPDTLNPALTAALNAIRARRITHPGASRR